MMMKNIFIFAMTLVWFLAACSPTAIETDAVEVSTPSPIATAVFIEPTIAPTATTVPESNPDDDLIAFIDELQTAVINQDTAAMQAMMSDPIGVGPWLAEWSLLTPEQTVAQFQSNAIFAPLSVHFTNLTMDEITTLLGQPPASMMGSDVNVVAALHSTGWGQSTSDEAILFITEENGRYRWSAFLYTNGRFADMYLETVSMPIGTIFSIYEEGYYQIQADLSTRQLLDAETASIPNILISPDGRHAAYLTLDDNKLWLVDTTTGLQEQVAADTNLSGFLMWGSNNVLFTGVWLDPNEADGPNNGHLATINIDENDRSVQILDEDHLSGGRPALTANNQTVAFDVFADSQDAITSRLYHPDSGVMVFDPTAFTAANDMIGNGRFNPSWSPDSRLMTWFSSTGERVGLQLYDFEAETAVQLFDWDPARFGALIPSPVWSPDGKWIALEVWANSPEGSGIWLIAAAGSSVTLVDGQGQNPYWANAEQLVFGVNGDEFLYDLPSEQPFEIDLPEGSWVWGVTSIPDLLTLPAFIRVQETDVEYVMAVQDVPMYEGPDASYARIGEIFGGQTAKVTGQDFASGWWRVICPDDTIGNCWVTNGTAFTIPTGG